MRIGVIGSGLMGRALGIAWAHAGHQVVFSYSRSPQKLESAAHEAGNGAVAGTPAEAAAADAVLIAVNWLQLDDALAQAGSLRGKTLLTCMLPMNDLDEDLAVGFDNSGAEVLAQKTGANVIGTFNTVWSDVIRTRTQAPTAPAPSMFYVGDDAAAKQTAETLIRDAGFDPVDVGGLNSARLLEPFGLLMGKLGFAYNPQVAYRFLNA